MAIAIAEINESPEIPIDSNIEAVAISNSFPRRIHICNVYIPQRFPRKLQDITPSDDKPNTTEVVRSIEHLPTNQNLNVVNTGSPKHSSTRNGKLAK